MPEYYDNISLEEADQYHAQAIDLLRESEQYFLCVRVGDKVTTIGGDRRSEENKVEAKIFANYVFNNAVRFTREVYNDDRT